MRQYLDLLRDVRTHGVRKPTRAVLRSTGAKIDALSVFGRQIRFDLGQGFPLVTTKRLSFNAIVHELIWFLRGSTSIPISRNTGSPSGTSGPPSLPRAELGIHGLNRWTVKC